MGAASRRASGPACTCQQKFSVQAECSGTPSQELRQDRFTANTAPPAAGQGLGMDAGASGRPCPSASPEFWTGVWLGAPGFRISQAGRRSGSVKADVPERQPQRPSNEPPRRRGGSEGSAVLTPVCWQSSSVTWRHVEALSRGLCRKTAGTRRPRPFSASGRPVTISRTSFSRHQKAISL